MAKYEGCNLSKNIADLGMSLEMWWASPEGKIFLEERTSSLGEPKTLHISGHFVADGYVDGYTEDE